MKRNILFNGINIKTIALFTVFICIACCTRKKHEINNLSSNATAGERLAKIHCVSCHQFPEPELLDSISWADHILPRMGWFLGIDPGARARQFLIEKGKGGDIVEAANVFPTQPLIDSLKWQQIRSYYLFNAPSSLNMDSVRKPIEVDSNLFNIHVPNYRLSPPGTSYIQLTSTGEVLMGDVHTGAFYTFNNGLKLQRAARVREGAVWMRPHDKFYRILVMGSFSPTDAPSGFLMDLPKNKEKPGVMIRGLQRPVHFAEGDLNGDGRQDIVICEFAKWSGGLNWWEKMEDGSFVKHRLRNRPGATKAYIVDMNQDGMQDVIALFGQGDEGIFIYYNQGNGTFSEVKVVPLSPSHGSSYFALFDFNGDGYEDILYTAGDNADFTGLLKPYHGIYIFENDGDNNFDQSFFYHLNGAYKAIPSDFDRDGDIDLAAISFFPDYVNQPEESFVFLEQTGNMEFKASAIPNATAGRWIVMDGEDYDRDGDLDLILGSLAFEVPGQAAIVQKWVSAGIPFIVLENVMGED